MENKPQQKLHVHLGSHTKFRRNLAALSLGKEKFFQAGATVDLNKKLYVLAVYSFVHMSHIRFLLENWPKNPSITSLQKQQHTNTQVVPYSTQHNSRGGPNLGTPSGTDCTCEHCTGGAGSCMDRDPKPHHCGQCPRKDWRLAWAASLHRKKLLCCCWGCLVLY